MKHGSARIKQRETRKHEIRKHEKKEFSSFAFSGFVLSCSFLALCFHWAESFFSSVGLPGPDFQPAGKNSYLQSVDRLLRQRKELSVEMDRQRRFGFQT